MEQQLLLKIKRLNKKARLPTRGSDHSAGYDLYSPVCGEVQPKKVCSVPLGISVEIPPGHYGRIAPRSSHALKAMIDVGGGVIDEDYRGEVCVVLFNHSDNVFRIDTETSIAQLILEKISTPEVMEVSELTETKRGKGGFGSTDNTKKTTTHVEKDKGITLLDMLKDKDVKYKVAYEMPNPSIVTDDDDLWFKGEVERARAKRSK